MESNQLTPSPEPQMGQPAADMVIRPTTARHPVGVDSYTRAAVAATSFVAQLAQLGPPRLALPVAALLEPMVEEQLAPVRARFHNVYRNGHWPDYFGRNWDIAWSNPFKK